ncbi:MAG: Rrf2 family transcriptional regulator [Opitutales bacterium]|nr:Rrf2 family transcriptional regulator [Opitutales bacterium]
MKISKRAEYGLRAVINLGIAEALERDRVTATDLAACDNLPLKFIEQIMGDLRGAGYVDTKRGRFGGYFIAKPMTEIRMGDIVRLLDGPLAPISCASQTAYEACSCPDEAHCGLRMLMIDVRNAIANILDRYTLENVVEVTLRKIRRDNASHFFLNDRAAKPATRPPSDPADPSDGFLAGLAGITKN